MSKKILEAVNRIPNERLEDLIHEAILEKMDEPDCDMRFQEFEVVVRKEVDTSLFVDIQVYGMAGDTTKDDFASSRNGQVQVIKGGGSIVITLDDDTEAKFVFSDLVNLNATDYLVTYRLA